MPLGSPPPPQEKRNIRRPNGSQTRRRDHRVVLTAAGRAIHPITAKNSQGRDRESVGRREPIVGATVLTITVKTIAWVLLKASVVGTSQDVPAGAPVQISDAEPVIPAPPMESIYLAIVVPAPTTTELELPVAMLRPSPWERPVPVSETVSGLLGAVLVTVRVPLNAPAFVGVDVNWIWHVANAARLAPQLLVSEKSSLT